MIPDEVTLKVPSPAVTVFEVAVFKVTAKTLVPLVNVEEAGKIARPSEEVIATVTA